jgi:hypothetical protein
MTKKSKRIFAAALVIWVLGAIWLASRTLDDLRSGKQPGSSGEALSLEHILFPSLKLREQE